jgi:hypothetical protein
MEKGQINNRWGTITGMVVSSLKVGMVILMVVISTFIISSCRGGDDELEGVHNIPMNDEKQHPEGGEKLTELKGPMEEETLDLQFTAKTRLTYFIDGVANSTEEGFVAISGSKTRYETPKSGELGYSLVTIWRGDLNLTYVLIPERSSYFVFGNEVEDEKKRETQEYSSSIGKTPPDYSNIFGGFGGMFSPSANEVSRTPLGFDEVLGYVCKKYKVKDEFLDGTFTYYTEWRAVDLSSIPIKTEYRLKKGSNTYITRWELVEIVRGVPSPDNFDVPYGYVKVRDLSETLKRSVPRKY